MAGHKEKMRFQREREREREREKERERERDYFDNANSFFFHMVAQVLEKYDLLSVSQLFTSSISKLQWKKHLQTRGPGPRFAHLIDIATADMQMLCNIFPILSSQLMKISSFEQFLVLKKNIWA